MHISASSNSIEGIKLQPHQTIIRRAQLPGILGISKSTIDRLRARGDFPAPRLLGEQALGFLRTDIDAWLASRPRAAH